MEKLLAGLAVFGLATAPAVAEARYDRKIDEAALAIVAGRMGELRGGFSYNARLVFVTVPDTAPAGSIASPAVGGAGDPRPAVTILPKGL